MPGKKPTYTGRDATKEATGIKHEISIHAPRTGRDLSDAERVDATLDISIHAPHTGRDIVAERVYFGESKFQSTRPIRGATQPRTIAASSSAEFQSTRPIRGATDLDKQTNNANVFQSTRPIRGATVSRVF